MSTFLIALFTGTGWIGIALVVRTVETRRLTRDGWYARRRGSGSRNGRVWR